MKKLFNILLFSLVPILVTSQITINKSIFSEANKSLILVSNEYGDIISTKILSDIPTDDYIYFLNRNDNQLLNLTIINEYETNGRHDFFACSYYNIPDIFGINNNLDFQQKAQNSSQEPTWVNIKIKNVYSNEDTFIPFTGPSIVRRRFGNLTIKTYKYANNDLFLLTNCNDENKYRYLYEPSDKIQFTMRYNWEDLETDLTYKAIPFPADTESLTIKSLNQPLGTACVLFSQEDLSETDSIYIPIPNEIGTTEYTASYSTPFNETDYQNHKITTTFTKIEDLSNFGYFLQNNHTSEYSIRHIDSIGFELDFSETNMDFAVTYLQSPFGSETLCIQSTFVSESPSCTPYIYTPMWTIIGTATEKVLFTLPILADIHLKHMPSLHNFNSQNINNNIIEIEQSLDGNNTIKSTYSNRIPYCILRKN